MCASAPLQLADTALVTCKQITCSLQGDSLMNEHQNQLLPEEVMLAECWLTMVYSTDHNTGMYRSNVPREPSSCDLKTIGLQLML